MKTPTSSVPTVVVSVSEFRAQFPRLYENYLAAESSQTARIVVKDMRSSVELFELVKIDPTQKKARRLANLSAIRKNQRKMSLNEKRTKQFRENFSQDLVRRKQEHDAITG